MSCILTEVNTSILFPSVRERLCLGSIVGDVHLREDAPDLLGCGLPSFLVQVCYRDIPTILLQLPGRVKTNARTLIAYSGRFYRKRRTTLPAPVINATLLGEDIF
jgi:hypothetical protein